MKIGIITFHCAHNYGAVLQAYALQKVLINNGCNVEIIDYKPYYLVSTTKVFIIKRVISKYIMYNLNSIYFILKYFKKKKERIKKFNAFINKYFNLSKLYNNKIPEDYDLYIIGSDQVWNKKITKGYDEVFTGYFNTKGKARKITYAASFGNINNILDNINEIKSFLNNFDVISIREENDATTLGKNTNHNIYHTIDPTLLLSENEWADIIHPTKQNNYIMIYQVRSDDSVIRMAKALSDKYNLNIIEIYSGNKYSVNENELIDVSPEEFLGYIKNAKCILTTSYHGTIFSIIYKKTFYTINLNDGSENRSKQLLKSINLEDRLVDKDSYIDMHDPNYEISENILMEMRLKSIKYLRNYL